MANRLGRSWVRCTVPAASRSLAVASVLFATALGGSELTAHAAGIAAIWPANAMLLAVLLRVSLLAWPAYLLIGYLAMVAATTVVEPAPLLQAALAGCNLVEIGLAGLLLRRAAGPRLDLTRPRVLLAVGVIAVGAAPAASACLATLLLADGTSPWTVWESWFLAHALGMAVILPPLLALRRSDLKSLRGRDIPIKAGGLLLATGLITVLVFSQERYPLLFLVTPALVAAAFAYGHLGAAAGVLVVAAIAMPLTGIGHGPLMLVEDTSAGERLLMLQVFLAASVLCSLPVGTALAARRRLEKQLALARERAVAADEAKSEFLAVMSHEIRTPLTAVIGIADLLAKRELDARSATFVEGIRRAGKQLLSIVNDTLDFLRLGAGRLPLHEIDFELDALLEEVRSTFAPIAHEKSLALEILRSTGVSGSLRGDPVRLRQVLFNLVSNALKFTDGGRIRVSASLQARGDDRRLLRIEVEDTGPGIPAAELPRLFQPFVQVEGTGSGHVGGAGLGLAICRQLVEAMAGRIGCESRLGDGSLFWFEVTLERGSAAVAAAEAAPAPAARPLNVLVAEDAPLNRDLMREMLVSRGHAVTASENGAQCLAEAETRAFDALLIDIQMPMLDGEEVIRRLRGGDGPNHRAPAIAITANVMAGDRSRYLEDGFDAVLHKPIAWSELFATIESLAAAPGEIGGAALPPLLDRVVLEEVAAVLEADGIDELLRQALAEAHDVLARLRAGEFDQRGRYRLAHRLKGSARSLGLTGIGAAAEAIESAARAGETLAPALDRLEQVLEATERLLARVRIGGARRAVTVSRPEPAMPEPRAWPTAPQPRAETAVNVPNHVTRPGAVAFASDNVSGRRAMIDPNVLLSGLLQGGARGPAMGRIDHAMSSQSFGGSGGSGGLLGQLGGLLGGGGGGGGGTLGALAGLAGGRGAGGFGGGGLGGGGLGGLAGSILGGGAGGGMGGSGMRGAVGGGGMALLGMLAMRALSNSGQARSAGLAEAPAGYGDQPQPPEHATSGTTAELLVRAMIAAAKADGQLDPTERQRITAKVEEQGAEPEEIEFLEREMERPLDADTIAAQARDPVVAGQVYAASVLAIQIDTPAERDYLRDLAAKLSLEPQTVSQLHQMLGAPQP